METSSTSTPKDAPAAKAEQARRKALAMVPNARERILGAVLRLRDRDVLTDRQSTTLTRLLVAFLDGEPDKLRSSMIVEQDIQFSDAAAAGRARVSEIRSSLEAYYQAEGFTDPIFISIPADRSTKLLVPEIRYRSWFEPFGREEEDLLRNARAAVDQRTPSAYAVAIAHLDKLLVLQPNHPRILGIKAEVHLRRALYGCRPLPELEEAQRLVRLALDQTDAFWEPHLADACVKSYLHLQWTEAGKAWDRARALPGGQQVSYNPWYLSYLNAQGRKIEVLQLIREKFDEGGFLHPSSRADVAVFCLFAGDRKIATRMLRDSIESSDANYYLSYLHLSLALERDDPQEALRIVKKIRLKPSQTGVTWGLKAFLHGRCEHRVRAWLGFKRLVIVRRIGTYIPASQLAFAAIGANRLEDAVRWLSRSVDEHDPMMDWIGAPWMRALYDVPAYRELITRMGLSLSATDVLNMHSSG